MPRKPPKGGLEASSTDEPPQLTPFDVEEQQIYSKFPLDG